MTKGIGRPPEQLNAGIVLQFFGLLGDFIQPLVGLSQILRFGSNIPIMKTPEPNSEFGEKLKSRVHGHLRNFHRIVRLIVIANNSTGTEGVAAKPLKGMPITNSLFFIPS